MNQAHEPGKRIVSKGEYVKAQGKRIGLGVSGVGLLASAVLSGIGILFFGFGFVYITFYLREPASVIAPVFCATVFCALLTYYLGRASIKVLKKAAQVKSGIPLTRANTADLPAPDSLVRASEEPRQVQEAVLLRATSEGHDMPPEELVRAVNGQE